LLKKGLQMDILIVAIIVAGAIVFTVKSFLKIYKGEKSCDCCSSCTGDTTNSCGINNNPEK
jgi:hypothetical protein